jgi:prepilin-type processing-associated H-X9-DG protein/prepilin-type N-terminal cleavage/methylation domain-containing protein
MMLLGKFVRLREALVSGFTLHNTPRLRSRRAFTLIELLVVIMLVMILIAMALPALRGARDGARTISCAAKASQLGMILRSFTSENKDRFPRIRDAAYGFVHPSYDPSLSLEKTWVDLLVARGYIEGDLASSGIPQSLRCPTAFGYDNDPTWAGYMPHYGVNINLSPPVASEATTGQRSFFSRPFDYTGDQSSKIMLADSKHISNLRGWHSMGNVNWVSMRHGPSFGANVVYLDGHVEFQRATTTVALNDPSAPFASINFWRQALP